MGTEDGRSALSKYTREELERTEINDLWKIVTSYIEEIRRQREDQVQTNFFDLMFFYFIWFLICNCDFACYFFEVTLVFFLFFVFSLSFFLRGLFAYFIIWDFLSA